MEQSKLERINELYKNEKAGGLTHDEEKEQKQLREEYIKSFRSSLRSQLDNVYVLDKDGNEVKLPKKNKPKTQ